MTHTPGPWIVHERKDGAWVVVGPDNLYIALCYVRNPGSHTEEANAMLIASAPETAAERDKLKALNAKLLADLEITLEDAQDRAAEARGR